MIVDDRRIQLERDDAARAALGDAIKKIEGLESVYKNDIYRKAWKVAIQSLRSMMAGAR